MVAKIKEIIFSTF